jgi:prepilin-type processing-associated H-X9-DG protein
VKATRIQHPTQIMLVIDSDSNTFAGGYYPAEHLRWRHQFGRGINLAFMDGHVETWNYSQLTNPLLPVKPQNPYNLLLNSTSYLPWGETLVPN